MKLRHAWMLHVLSIVLAGCASTGGRLVQPGPNPAGGRLTSGVNFDVSAKSCV